MSKRVFGRDLGLGDIVRGSHEPYSDATVIQVKPNEDPGLSTVVLFRPYVVTSDFSYTGGVIPYIGTETYSIWFTTEIERIRKAQEPR